MIEDYTTRMEIMLYVDGKVKLQFNSDKKAKLFKKWFETWGHLLFELLLQGEEE